MLRIRVVPVLILFLKSLFLIEFYEVRRLDDRPETFEMSNSRFYLQSL